MTHVVGIYRGQNGVRRSVLLTDGGSDAGLKLAEEHPKMASRISPVTPEDVSCPSKEYSEGNSADLMRIGLYYERIPRLYAILH